MPQVSNYSLQMDNPSLVDYGYGAPSPRVKHRNSDIDFRDVFGGPPRRASVHDVRYSFTEGMDSVEVLGRRIGEASIRDPWKAGEEKPVFGEAESVSRRRYLREDFFDDIFKGGESPSSTPRNVFSLSPGSRVLSPARRLPARVDGSGSPPSLPLGSQESFESSEKLDDSKKDSEEHQFHFSTYNWANQGVSIPVVMPFNRTNSKNPKEFKGRQIFQDVDAAAAHDDESRTDRGGEISEIKVMDVNQDLIEEERQEKEDVKKVPLQESQKPADGFYPKRRGKSKVKDFLRIFNQETPSKPRTPNSHPSQGSVREEEEEEPTLTVEAATQQEKRRRNAIDDVKRNISKSVEVPKKEPDASDKISSTSRRSQKEDSKSTTSTGFPENFPENARAEEADDFSQANFTMKELSEEEQQQGEATGESDEIQATDAKIHEWARGKEGNIRSLLTTLQFVLWPGSGWKPVALMNIIEGPGVKRAYQKAMLCLHPDKLQQKGASFLEKYVAEKALYILQEAWDHFNTLGGL